MSTVACANIFYHKIAFRKYCPMGSFHLETVHNAKQKVVVCFFWWVWVVICNRLLLRVSIKKNVFNHCWDYLDGLSTLFNIFDINTRDSLNFSFLILPFTISLWFLFTSLFSWSYSRLCLGLTTLWFLTCLMLFDPICNLTCSFLW